MKKMKFAKGLVTAILGLSILMVSCKKEGCTDPLATNYNKKANKDDGTCEYDGTTPGTTLEVTDNIDSPTTWSAATVKVCGNIEVNAALTIQPGVTVVFCASNGLEVTSSGSIKAIGTAAAPIVFEGETSSPGYWSGIYIGSNNPNNHFEYVTVKDAGSYWFWEFANIYVADLAKLTLVNSTVSNSEKYGVFMADGATFPAFSNNTFSNNTLAGLNISAKQAGSLDGASNYNSGNGEDFINVRGSTLNTNTTWNATTTPYLIVGEVSVSAGLILNAGVNILMEANSDIEIEESGYFTAVGTAVNPISIQGRFSSAGYWEAIYIQSNNPNNKMAHVTLKDGGSYWFYDYATVNVGGRLEMDNCSISNSNSWAMVAGGSASIYCGGVVQTDAAGVLSHNTITGNGVGPDADCADGGCTVLFN